MEILRTTGLSVGCNDVPASRERLRTIVLCMTSMSDEYEAAFQRVRGSLLPKERRDRARRDLLHYRGENDVAGLREYMQRFDEESDKYSDREHGDFLREFEAAALSDIAYAIAIAKPAGALAARRRAKEQPVERPVGDSDAVEPSRAVRVRVCPPEHPHGKTQTCYGGHGCRCDECRSAVGAYRKRWLLSQGATRTAQPKKRADWTPEPLSDDDSRHGTRGGYANYGCRCQPCAEASKIYMAEKRKHPSGRSKTSEHGTTGRYVRGCRCALCFEAMAEDHRQRKNSN